MTTCVRLVEEKDAFKSHAIQTSNRRMKILGQQGRAEIKAIPWKHRVLIYSYLVRFRDSLWNVRHRAQRCSEHTALFSVIVEDAQTTFLLE